MKPKPKDCENCCNNFAEEYVEAFDKWMCYDCIADYNKTFSDDSDKKFGY